LPITGAATSKGDEGAATALPIKAIKAVAITVWNFMVIVCWMSANEGGLLGFGVIF
jgi:hypothetical protein